MMSELSGPNWVEEIVFSATSSFTWDIPSVWRRVYAASPPSTARAMCVVMAEITVYLAKKSGRTKKHKSPDFSMWDVLCTRTGDGAVSPRNRLI